MVEVMVEEVLEEDIAVVDRGGEGGVEGGGKVEVD